MAKTPIAGSEYVKKNGGKIKLIKYDERFSTSKIIKKISKISKY